MGFFSDVAKGFIDGTTDAAGKVHKTIDPKNTQWPSPQADAKSNDQKKGLAK